MSLQSNRSEPPGVFLFRRLERRLVRSLGTTSSAFHLRIQMWDSAGQGRVGAACLRGPCGRSRHLFRSRQAQAGDVRPSQTASARYSPSDLTRGGLALPPASAPSKVRRSFSSWKSDPTVTTQPVRRLFGNRDHSDFLAKTEFAVPIVLVDGRDPLSSALFGRRHHKERVLFAALSRQQCS